MVSGDCAAGVTSLGMRKINIYIYRLKTFSQGAYPSGLSNGTNNSQILSADELFNRTMEDKLEVLTRMPPDLHA
jgi:hypothetical protein